MFNRDTSIETRVLNFLNENRNGEFPELSNSALGNCNYAKYGGKTEKWDYYYIEPGVKRLDFPWYLVLYHASTAKVYLFYIPAKTFRPKDFEIRNKVIRDVERDVLEMNVNEDEDFSDRNNFNPNLRKYLFKTFDFYAGEPNEDYYGDLANEPEPYHIPEDNRVKGGKNVICYGIPGCGKTYTVNEKLKSLNIDETTIMRVTFHLDYSYADFVGQLLPTQYEDDPSKVQYKFIPGPFTEILVSAMNDPYHEYYLIIDEVNRGNAPAIFGDIFQLLDRDKNGKSKYVIDNNDLRKEYSDIFKDGIYIPSNLSILCTMNTSDQNVYPLDTAFQRRWQMQYIKDNIKQCPYAKRHIGDRSNTVTWEEFHDIINAQILNNTSIVTTDDKRLGAYFCSEEEIADIDLFVNKVLKYLWDDAFKLRREAIFDKENIHSFEDIINTVSENKIEESESFLYGIFRDGIF